MSTMPSRVPTKASSHNIPPQVKEYAQAEGVSAKLGVALELAEDLSHRNGVPETVEYCEKVPRSFARPHVDLVPGGNRAGMHLKHADT